VLGDEGPDRRQLVVVLLEPLLAGLDVGRDLGDLLVEGRRFGPDEFLGGAGRPGDQGGQQDETG
jgi:hypothetical protein